MRATRTPAAQAHSSDRILRDPVYSIPLDQLRDKIIDLTPYFTDEKYRFVDTKKYLHQRALTIYEMDELPAFYVAISYVWSGLTAYPADLALHGSFRVSCGTRDRDVPVESDPISIKVMEYACHWACDINTRFLWLDQLCIKQTSKRDKAWQIPRMYTIYEECEQCIVFPGGLQRLASMFEETSWAGRAWTYPEAMATWEHAVVLTSDSHRPSSEQHWLIPGECHWQYMLDLFLVSDEFRLFGANKDAQEVLRSIVEYRRINEEYTIRRLIILGGASRTSSVPVDMVLSIIGATGVADQFPVEIVFFKDNDRFRATVALVHAIFLQDAEEFDDEEASVPHSSLITIPLWQSITLIGASNANNAIMPSLQELAQLLDDSSDEDEVEIAAEGMHVCLKRGPLLGWNFDIEATDTENIKSRAASIASKIPETVFMKVYHGGADRHIIRHEDEGLIELSRRMSLQVTHDSDAMDKTLDSTIFGWSLKLKEAHPYITFFMFDVTHLSQ